MKRKDTDFKLMEKEQRKRARMCPDGRRHESNKKKQKRDHPDYKKHEKQRIKANKETAIIKNFHMIVERGP